MADVDGSGRARRSRPRLAVGVVVLSIVGVYVATWFAHTGAVTEFELLLATAGGVLGGTLVGEYASERFRERSHQSLLFPAVELLVTFAVAGFTLAAVYSGRATTGVVGGAVLFCSFLSVILTRPLRDFS